MKIKQTKITIITEQNNALQYHTIKIIIDDNENDSSLPKTIHHYRNHYREFSAARWVTNMIRSLLAQFSLKRFSGARFWSASLITANSQQLVAHHRKFSVASEYRPTINICRTIVLILEKQRFLLDCRLHSLKFALMRNDLLRKKNRRSPSVLLI